MAGLSRDRAQGHVGPAGERGRTPLHRWRHEAPKAGSRLGDDRVPSRKMHARAGARTVFRSLPPVSSISWSNALPFRDGSARIVSLRHFAHGEHVCLIRPGRGRRPATDL
jgi:hypothetical protein